MKSHTHTPRGISRKGQRGLTLLEVMLVLALSLMLVAITSIRSEKVRRDARRSTCIAQQSVIWQAKRIAWDQNESLSNNANADDVVLAYLDERELPYCPDNGTHRPSGNDSATMEHVKASFTVDGQTERTKPTCKINPEHARQ